MYGLGVLECKSEWWSERNNHQAGIGGINSSPHLDGFPHEAVAGLVRAGEV